MNLRRAIVATVVLVAAFLLLLDRLLPLPELSGSWDPVNVGQASLEGGPVPPAALRELAQAGSLRVLSDVRPLAGRSLVPTRVAGQEVLLPEGLGALLLGGSLDVAVEQAVERGLLNHRGTDGVVASDPDLRARVQAGLRAELETWGPRLVAGEPRGHHDVVLIRGEGRLSAWHLPKQLAPHAERETWKAWMSLLMQGYAELGVPAWSLALGLPEGGRFDLEGWLAERTGDFDPFFALGRLQAVHLLARAKLVGVVFAGHGRQVRSSTADEDRFGTYALGDLRRGDPCEELAILRRKRGGASLRFGLCVPVGTDMVSLSCSLSEDGRAGPQHGMAALGWFLRNGSWPDFEGVEPVAFRIFPRLQERQLAASTMAELGPATAETVLSFLPELAADRSAGGLARIGEGLWRLRVGGTAEPDVILVAPEVAVLSREQAARITAATTTWRMERAGPMRSRRRAERVDPCNVPAQCERALASLSRFGPLPTDAGQGLFTRLGRHRVRLLAVPDHTNPWVRLAVLRAPGESETNYVERAWALRSSVVDRRVLGLHLW